MWKLKLHAGLKEIVLRAEKQEVDAFQVNQFRTILAAVPEKRNILMHHTTLTMSRANREISHNNGLT